LKGILWPENEVLEEGVVHNLHMRITTDDREMKTCLVEVRTGPVKRPSRA